MDRRLTPGGDPGRPAVWVSRALPAAHATAARVAALGFEAIVEPVIALRPLPFDPAVVEGVAALAFTSAAGVRAFAATCTTRTLPVFAVGRATAAAARACGYPDVRSADGDVAALDRLIAADAPPGRVLAPGALAPAGRLARAERLPVYATAASPGPWPRAEAAAGAGRLVAALAQSPSAARVLAACGLAAAGAPILWLAASPACAAPLLHAGLTDVRVADSPREDALLRRLPTAAATPWQATAPPAMSRARRAALAQPVERRIRNA